MTSPGPWRKCVHICAVEDANGRVLFKSSAATDQDEDLAALAPELLDALKDAMKLIDVLFPGLSTSPSRIMRCSTTCR